MYFNDILNVVLLFLTIFFYFYIFKKRKKIASYLNVNDIPDLKRKSHKKSVPKTASYSILLTLICVLIFNQFFYIYDKEFNILILGTIFTFFIGFADDKFKLSPYTRLLLISIVIIFSSYENNNLIISKIYFETYNSFFNLNNFSILFTILCFLLLANALNLSDGINGLAIGIVMIWLFFIFKDFYSNFNFIIMIIFFNLILMFFHNLKEKHFLGDSGSLMLSVFVAYLIIYKNNITIDQTEKIQISAEQIFILFMIPGLDMMRLFIERILKKKDPFSGDRNHLHHYLLNRNSLKKTLIIYFLLMLIPIILKFYLTISSIIIILITTFVYIMLISYLKLNKIEN